jgi:hypothetical protein
MKPLMCAAVLAMLAVPAGADVATRPNPNPCIDPVMECKNKNKYPQYWNCLFAERWQTRELRYRLCDQKFLNSKGDYIWLTK